MMRRHFSATKPQQAPLLWPQACTSGVQTALTSPQSTSLPTMNAMTADTTTVNRDAMGE